MQESFPFVQTDHSPGHINCPKCEELRLAMQSPSELSSLLFPEAARIWLESHERHISAVTCSDYRKWTRMLSLFFGNLRLSEIHLGHIEEYQRARLAGELGPQKRQAGAAVINHEMTVLTQVLKRAGLWGLIEPHYQPLKVPKSRRGRALTEEQENRLLGEATKDSRLEVGYWCAVLSANTTAGPGEIRKLRIKDVQLNADPPTIHIREGLKNEYRERYIPLNEEARLACLKLLTRARRLGAESPEHYLLPHRSGENGAPADPTRPMYSWRKSWEHLREAAGMPTLRMYDLRHHAITKLLENEDVSERTVIDVAGHVSKHMLERYSHIRMKTKATALDALSRKGPRVEPPPKLVLIKK